MKAEKTDVPQLRALWETAFKEDSKAFLDLYFGRLSADNVRVIKENGKIVTCLHLQDIVISQHGKDYKAAYIGGVATAPEYRLRGYYKKLMEDTLSELSESGYDMALLIPFSFGFYKKSGFEISSYYIEVRGKTEDASKAVLPKGAVCHDTFWKRTEAEMQDIRNVFETDGAKYFCGDGFYAFYYYKKDFVYIAELSYLNAGGFKNALEWISSLNAGSFVLRTAFALVPCFSERCFDIKLCPHTMIRIFNPDFKLTGVYNNSFNLLGYV